MVSTCHCLPRFRLIIYFGLPFQKDSPFTSHTSSFYCSLFTFIPAFVYISYPDSGFIIQKL